jgi:hypothetical protein
VLEAEIRGAREPLHVFTTRPQPMIDLQVGSWYASTYPESTFVVGLSAALVTDDARYNLRGRNLAIHAPRTLGTGGRLLPAHSEWTPVGLGVNRDFICARWHKSQPRG